jgi:hypothetical protein
MLEKKKTLCVGRILVDVPEQAATSISGEMIQGFAIDTFEESEEQFRERLKSRESEIAVQPTDAKDPGGLVATSDLHTPGMIGRVLVYGRDHAYGIENGSRVESEWVSIEAHAHLNGMSFTLSKKFASEADASTAEALLAGLHLRDEYEIPSVPGFCIRRAFFAESLFRRKNEHITLHLGLPGHPDFGLALSSMPGGDEGNTLLERTAKTDSESSIDEMIRVTKLRSRKRTVNGFDGEEEVERVRELNFTTGYSFMWEFRGVANDPLQPFLSLNMETGTNPRPGGKPVESSLHEDASVALWDAISSSIRLRKVGVSSTSSEIKPTAHFNAPCLHFSNAKCVPDEILFDSPRFDFRTASRQPILSSVPGSIATLVSTLP